MDTEQDTELLRAELRAAARDLHVRPGFEEAVVRGGRRRQQRRLAGLIALTATTTVLTVAGGIALVSGLPPLVQSPMMAYPDPHKPKPTPTGSDPASSGPDTRWWARPTTGDLAEDREFVERAFQVWHAELEAAFLGPHGQPHAVWAGNTPAGRAAVVTQDLVTPDGEAGNRPFVGLIGNRVDDRDLHLLSLMPVELVPGFLFGPDDRVLLMVDPGTTLRVSYQPVVAPDGKVTRSWQPMSARDGAAIAAVPAGLDPAGVAVSTETPEQPGQHARAPLGIASREAVRTADRDIHDVHDAQLPWQGAVLAAGEPRPSFAQPRADFDDALRRHGMTDEFAPVDGTTPWAAVAGYGGDRTAVLGERYDGVGPSRLYAALYRGSTLEQIVHLGALDPDSQLPVRLRLPDDAGWVVAAKDASLSYAVAGDTWQLAGRGAALVPDVASTVQVARAGQLPAVFQLK